MLRRFPEALATVDRVFAWDPTKGSLLSTKAEVFLATGDLHAAEPLLLRIRGSIRFCVPSVPCSSAVMLRPLR